MEYIKDLWSWYLNLFSDADNRVVIAAWTATIATLSFILTFLLKPLFSYLKRSAVKIKVEMGMPFIFLVVSLN